MMYEVERLREKADLCYRLADTILDEQMAKALLEYAADTEKRLLSSKWGLCCRVMFEAASLVTVTYY
jgi:hypothetical protein